MKTVLLALLVMLTCIHVSVGQRFSLELWHKGYVITVDEDTIQGDIKYNIEDNYITVKRNEKFIPVSHHKLLKFVIEDQNQRVVRTFYSLPYSISRGKKPFLIFEILLEAPQTLMARERIITEYNQGSSTYNGFNINTARNRLAYDMYFLNPKGDVTAFGGTKKDLFQYIGYKYEMKVREYMKSEKLKVEKRKDLIKIFRFYNQLRYKTSE